MPPKLKTALKAIGYVVFFLAALVLFTIATLPLDALEDYMVRKASDEYGADLEITELSMWGLSGLEMEGVTLTPRPSPEEIAEIRAATEARAAWQKRQDEKAAGGADEATADEDAPEAAAADLPEGVALPGSPEARAAAARAKRAAARLAKRAAGEEGEDGEATAETDTPEPGTRARKRSGTRAAAATAEAPAAKTDEPPPVPAGPQPLYIEALRAKVGLLKLVSDLTDGKVFNEAGEAELEAQFLGGSITARVERTTENLDLDAAFSGLDLSQLTVLRNLLPLPIVGGFDGQIDLEVPLDDTGRMRLASTTGFVTLTMSDAVIGPGKIEADALRNFGGSFDIPRLRLESFGGRIGFEQRRATFEDFSFRGKDLEGGISGYVQLANTFERFNPRAYLRFKFSDAFLDREKSIGVLMRSVNEIKRGTGTDGFTGFAVSMRTDPKTRGKRLSWRPTPRDPYGARDASGAPVRSPATPSVRPGRSRVDRSRRPTTPRIPRPPATPSRVTPKPGAATKDAPDDEPIADDEGEEGEGEGEVADEPTEEGDGEEGEGEGEGEE